MIGFVPNYSAVRDYETPPSPVGREPMGITHFSASRLSCRALRFEKGLTDVPFSGGRRCAFCGGTGFVLFFCCLAGAFLFGASILWEKRDEGGKNRVSRLSHRPRWSALLGGPWRACRLHMIGIVGGKIYIGEEDSFGKGGFWCFLTSPPGIYFSWQSTGREASREAGKNRRPAPIGTERGGPESQSLIGRGRMNEQMAGRARRAIIWLCATINGLRSGRQTAPHSAI